MRTKSNTNPSSLSPRQDPVVAFTCLGVALIAVIAVASYASLALTPLAAYAAGATFGTFLLCGYDKGIAGGPRTRVPERVFYLLALIGGSLGLLFGMRFFRHKIRKVRFQFFLVLVFAAQFCIYYLLSGQH